MADYNAGWTDWSLQLFTRVMQFGAFSPIFTNCACPPFAHTCHPHPDLPHPPLHPDGNVAQDDNTWLLPPPFFNATRTALTARNRLLPYRYTLARVGHETAVSSVRPMYYAHPWISDAYNAPHQYDRGVTVRYPCCPLMLVCYPPVADTCLALNCWLRQL